jgi:activator of HSP90 ATPase
MEKITVSVELPVQKEVLFQAWLDSDEHSSFTGSTAEIDPSIGGGFLAWDGYISGKTLKKEPPNRILQAWRTTEFADDDADSKLEILFESISGGTRLTLIHTDIPAGQGEMYREGWEEYYFRPMLEYFIYFIFLW